jgi:hypothetical protein
MNTMLRKFVAYMSDFDFEEYSKKVELYEKLGMLNHLNKSYPHGYVISDQESSILYPVGCYLRTINKTEKFNLVIRQAPAMANLLREKAVDYGIDAAFLGVIRETLGDKWEVNLKENPYDVVVFLNTQAVFSQQKMINLLSDLGHVLSQQKKKPFILFHFLMPFNIHQFGYDYSPFLREVKL